MLNGQLLFIIMVFVTVFLLMQGLVVPVFGESAQARKRLQQRLDSIEKSQGADSYQSLLRDKYLKNLSPRFPLQRLTCVTGVSGSGKSTLVRDVLHDNLHRLLQKKGKRKNTSSAVRTLGCRAIKGVEQLQRVLEVDQTPIGKTPRSCPATYVGVWDEIRKLFAVHPDASIFGSLPGVGARLAPALLAKFGDNRQRFPTAQTLQSVAGTCPYTKQSGKRKYVLFRRACDREFRQIAQQWAKASLDQSVWANTYFQMVRPRCKSTSHAYRCLANRWLAIAWRIWQDGVPYDENLHLRQHALRAKPF